MNGTSFVGSRLCFKACPRIGSCYTSDMPTFGHKHTYKARLAISHGQRGNTSGCLSTSKPAPKGKPIGQYDLNGECVGFYPSLTAAAKKTAVCGKEISFVANGKRKTAGGFQWKWWNAEQNMGRGAHQCRSVAQYSVTGAFIREYPSVTVAANAMSVTKGNISGSITRGGTAAGFVWKYTD